MPHEEKSQAPARWHSLSLEGRERLSITGVEDVSGFDEGLVLLRTGRRRGAALGQALLLGLGLALLYDLLRPLRRRAGGAAPLLDLSFSVLAGAAPFLFAMRAPNGRMGLWELAAAMTGFLLWEHVLCRFKRGLTAFRAQIRAKKDAEDTKFRQKKASKN